MKLRSPHDTEPDVVVGVVGRDADAALRRAAVAGVAAPAAAAQQTGRTSRGPCGVCKWARGVVRTAIPILAPLPHIARHVVQAKRVGKFTTDGVGLAP